VRDNSRPLPVYEYVFCFYIISSSAVSLEYTRSCHKFCYKFHETSSFLRERCENWCQSVSRNLLQGVVKPLNTNLFNGQKWVFQQDSAPAHKAKTTQEWLRRHVPAFINAEDWPSGSPDLNLLDYKL